MSEDEKLVQGVINALFEADEREYGCASYGVQARAAIAAVRAWDAEQGLVLVPREPTPEMFGAGGVALFKADCAMHPPREVVWHVYRAMIATPAPQSDGEG